MELIALIGRILFCIMFLNVARSHLTKVSMMAQYSASKGAPVARLMVVLTGLMLLLGGLSILLGFWVKVGAALLVLFLVPTAFIMHNFWTVTDPVARANDQAHFLKDLALAGAALMFFACGIGPLTIAP